MLLYYLASLLAILVFSEWPTVFWGTVVVGVAAGVVKERGAVFWLAFLSGLLQDIFNAMPLGMTAVWLLGLVVAIFWLETKFRKSLRVALLVATVFGLVYGWLANFEAYVPW